MKRHVAESAAWSLIAAILIGTAGHWFLTPMRHPDASRWQTARVVIQFVIGIAAGAYAAHRVRLEREAEREDADLDRTA
jgi:peptidoglycan/LPS O-acetylase OafA/YrhL